MDGWLALVPNHPGCYTLGVRQARGGGGARGGRGAGGGAGGGARSRAAKHAAGLQGFRAPAPWTLARTMHATFGTTHPHPRPARCAPCVPPPHPPPPPPPPARQVRTLLELGGYLTELDLPVRNWTELMNVLG